MLYAQPFSYWFYLGTIYLAWLTLQDFRNGMLIDDRKNYFMLGVTISLLSHLHNTLLYNVAAVITVQVLFMAFKRLKPLGEGDLSAIRWSFLGFAFIGVVPLIIYAGTFIILGSIYFGVKKAFGHSEYTPYFLTLLLGFILAGYISRIY